MPSAKPRRDTSAGSAQSATDGRYISVTAVFVPSDSDGTHEARQEARCTLDNSVPFDEFSSRVSESLFGDPDVAMMIQWRSECVRHVVRHVAVFVRACLRP